MDPNFTMIQQMSLTEFRKRFSEITKDRVAEVIVTRKGELIGAFLGIEAYRQYLTLINNPPSMKEES